MEKCPGVSSPSLSWLSVTFSVIPLVVLVARSKEFASRCSRIKFYYYSLLKIIFFFSFICIFFVFPWKCECREKIHNMIHGAIIAFISETTEQMRARTMRAKMLLEDITYRRTLPFSYIRSVAASHRIASHIYRIALHRANALTEMLTTRHVTRVSSA